LPPTVCQHVVVSFTYSNLSLPTRVGQHTFEVWRPVYNWLRHYCMLINLSVDVLPLRNNYYSMAGSVLLGTKTLECRIDTTTTNGNRVVISGKKVTIPAFSNFAEWTLFVVQNNCRRKICCSKRRRCKYIFRTTRERHHQKENAVWPKDFQGISRKLRREKVNVQVCSCRDEQPSRVRSEKRLKITMSDDSSRSQLSIEVFII